MPLPEVMDSGDLPHGIHRATLGETLDCFGTSTLRRMVVASRLERVYRLAATTGHLARFVVFGSFVTAKPNPNDVDVFMLMEDTFHLERVEGDARWLFEHAVAQARLGASVFWLRRSAVLWSEQAAVEDWQIKRDGSRRGIVEIISEVP